MLSSGGSRPSVWSKNKRGLGPSPRSATAKELVRSHARLIKIWALKTSFSDEGSVNR